MPKGSPLGRASIQYTTSCLWRADVEGPSSTALRITELVDDTHIPAPVTYHGARDGDERIQPVTDILSLSSFAEIIPQSLCTRYGLYFGAKMAGTMRVLLWTLVSSSYPCVTCTYGTAPGFGRLASCEIT